MARAKRKVPVQPEPTSKYLLDISYDYARYTLDYRGIPTFTDGLKNAQRIAMHLMRTTSGKMKTAAFAGAMIESGLYVHGDKSAADTVSNMAAPYTNNEPLIKGDGAFGTRGAPNVHSAPRYTSVLRSKFAEAMYTDFDIAPQMENYDGSATMPATFLPLLPMLLLNGVSGIATAWTTKILPRSLDDLKTATLEYLKTGKISGRLFPKYKNYDVKITRGDEPTKFVVSGKFERIGTSKIHISEIPLEGQSSIFNMAAYREYLAKLEEIGVILDFTNRSKDQIDIDIELAPPGTSYMDPEKKRPQVVPKWTDEDIFKMFKLRHTITERIVALGPPDDPGVRQFETPHDVIKAFVDWRLGWYRVRYEKLAQIDRDRELFYLSYLASYEDVVEGLKKLQNKTALKELIAKAIKKGKLEVREEIVERLAVLPAYRWTKEEHADAKKQAAEANKSATENTNIAKSPARHRKIYEAEIEEIRT